MPCEGTGFGVWVQFKLTNLPNQGWFTLQVLPKGSWLKEICRRAQGSDMMEDGGIWAKVASSTVLSQSGESVRG